MNISPKQFSVNFCSKQNFKNLNCVHFTPIGAISTDGHGFIVIPYPASADPETIPTWENPVLVPADDCKLAATFFKACRTPGVSSMQFGVDGIRFESADKRWMALKRFIPEPSSILDFRKVLETGNETPVSDSTLFTDSLFLRVTKQLVSCCKRDNGIKVSIVTSISSGGPCFKLATIDTNPAFAVLLARRQAHELEL